MAGGTRIIAFESGAHAPDKEEFLLLEEVIEPEAEQIEWHEEEEHPLDHARGVWLAPTLAFLAVAAWTGFFIWAGRERLTALANPAAWPDVISDWAMPVVLIGMIWLLFMRNSRREAMRFGGVANMLADESARLEERLVAVNRELSLAREFIAAQTRDLDAIGRIAVERLSTHSDRLHGLIEDNGARLDSIGTVSETALDNMEKLRGQLPVIASSAKDVTNNIGNAGRAAAAQLAEMVDGFQRLNEFGQASERQVGALRSRVDEALAEFSSRSEQMEVITSQRFAELTERGAEFRSQLDTQEVEALAAIRTRAAALAEEVTQTRSALDTQEAESLTSLRARLSALRDEGGALSRSIRESEARSLDVWRESITRLDEELRGALSALETAETNAAENTRARLEALTGEIAALEGQLAERGEHFDSELSRRRAVSVSEDEAAVSRISERLAGLDQSIAERRIDHERQTAALAEHGETISQQLAGFESYLGQIAARAGETETSFSASAEALSRKLSESHAELAGTDREIAQLTDASIRLLEILQASKQQTREELPGALSANEERLAALESRATALRDIVVETGQHGEGLSNLIQSSESELRAMFARIDQLQATFAQANAAQSEALAELRGTLTAAGEQSSELAEKAQGELSQAIDKLVSSAAGAIATIDENAARAVSSLADQLGEESARAIDKAMRASATDAAGQLEQAAAQATSVSRDAAIQLRDQLAKVNELVGNLERRVAHARQRAEEQVDNDFARRAALITESLNSNAIDIAKALSTDVSDTAWSAYLRGDRGIFTRRAVRLIESGEAKAIAQIFEQDQDFREHVSRFIHDFEAILREILSTRDGHALGITLLSSDMGKLYVALAQAIERLRK